VSFFFASHPWIVQGLRPGSETCRASRRTQLGAAAAEGVTGLQHETLFLPAPHCLLFTSQPHKALAARAGSSDCLRATASPCRPRGAEPSILPLPLPAVLGAEPSILPLPVPAGPRAEGKGAGVPQLLILSSSTRGSFLTKKQDQAARKIMRFLRRCRHRMRELKQNQELEGLPQPGLAT